MFVYSVRATTIKFFGVICVALAALITLIAFVPTYVGASVTAGQQIGTVGESATLELAEEPHLHLEMTVKGLAIDPLEYFSAQALAAIGTDQSHEQAENATE